MGDRELLEMAAKAAGIGPVIGFAVEAGELMIGPRKHIRYWNPIADDGSRYRLIKALKLGIDFTTQEVIYWKSCDPVPYTESFAADGDDARAVLRAAAKIGRSMP